MLRARSPVRPERRTRADVIVAVVLAVVVLGGGVLYWRSSAAATTESVTAAPGTFPQPPSSAATVPAGFTQAWREPSAATSAPLVVGPAVVTADGGAVTGRDATTGTAHWSYTRTAQLCTAGSGFGEVMALYRNHDATACSELTVLAPSSGARRAQSNPDALPGTRLLDTGTLVAITGANYVQVVRSDLVKTTEYGTVATPDQPGRQPRPDCDFGSFAVTQGRLAVLERCPGESDDRLTVVAPDGGSDATTPSVVFSQPQPGPHGQVVAASGDRVAVARPAPARLEVVDGQGNLVSTFAVPVPDADLAADPPGGVARTTSDNQHIYWWTGSATVAIDRGDLTPAWTLPDTSGPAVRYGDSVLVPVRGGLQVVNPATGAVGRTIPVDRGSWTGPVVPGVAGSVLLEQRGPELVALTPAR
ncbi:hypothetical protein Psed_1068 [Pseudonocardia dioxanivorans CB1190]|uniref:Pyrrolo-quinoline quinone repeat-containing protein n=1 Tax=Pseudonocardia dioxanivorans (strain ATCC 55486 / DSM 44775 / JCM 13855 / CB1190) TaxID=675635 RepID=F4CP53_PSEUX|nr:hypothetical protein [Pseudonocardia dioxanivorans]AEA23319.1 hypothetical protein Psed_1068 [Pseudonocardia dioxanivorans CB1190]